MAEQPKFLPLSDDELRIGTQLSTMRKEQQLMIEKKDEITDTVKEHERVLAFLKTLKPDHPVYHHFGDILEKQTAKEVAPKVQKNTLNLIKTCETYEQSINKRSAEIEALLLKWKPIYQRAIQSE